MAATRTPEEIRRSIEANRAELGLAVEKLRGEVAEVTDWRKQLRNNQKQVMIGAAVAGFVLGGGIAAMTGLLTGGRRLDLRRRHARRGQLLRRRVPERRVLADGDLDRRRDGDGQQGAEHAEQG